MALKLSRDLKNKQYQETSKTGFNIECLPGKEYDLDEILKLRQRNNPDAPLGLKLISVDDATSKEILDRIIREVDLMVYENLMLPSVKEAISNVITDTYERFGYIVGEEINGDRYDMVYDVINRKITRHLNSISDKFKLDYTIMPGVSLPDIVVKYDLTESFLGSEEFSEIMVDYYNRYTSKINANYKEDIEGGMSMQGGEERIKKVSPTQADYEKYLLN